MIDNIFIISDWGIILFNLIIELFCFIELDNGLFFLFIINGCGVWMCSDYIIFIGGIGGFSFFLEKDLNKEYFKFKFYFLSLFVNNVWISLDDKSCILIEGFFFVWEINLNVI